MIFSTLALALLSLTPGVYSQSTSATQQLRLDRIEVVGLRRYTKEQVVEASGLQIGQLLNTDLLDAAATRMSGSGLFKKLTSRLKGAAGKAVVTFEIEELTGGDPVVFDNFVWFAEDELATAIKHDLPSFDGTASEAGEITSRIAGALQRLLDERKIAGKVEYTPSADVSGRNAKHIFSVKGVPIPICSVRFAGATDVQESDLIKSSNPFSEPNTQRSLSPASQKRTSSRSTENGVTFGLHFNLRQQSRKAFRIAKTVLTSLCWLTRAARIPGKRPNGAATTLFHPKNWWGLWA